MKNIGRLSVLTIAAVFSVIFVFGSSIRTVRAEGGQPDAGVGAEPGTVVVYSNDFENKAGLEWSTQATAQTPKGGRRFLGPFANHKVHLTLKNLPPHKYVRVSFDLFIMKTWDGGDLRDPDIWNLKVQGGPKLIHCTFATARGENLAQTFPDNLPGPLHRGRTGAAEHLTLGYVWRNDPLDAVYKLQPAFPHTGKDLTLTFSGSALQEVADESWGLDNVKIELLSGPKLLTRPRLDREWNALIGNDPVKAFNALWTLVLAGDQTASLAARRLKPPAVDAARVETLIAELDSDKWTVREEAQKELANMGGDVASLLRKSLKDKPGLEAETRIKALLLKFEPQEYSGQLGRYLRVIRLLELIGSKASAASLKILSQNAPTEELQCHSAAAARRITAQPAGWIDLLSRVDAHTYRANGEWTSGASVLYVSPVTYAKLPLPVAPRGDYEIVAEFMRRSGSGDVNLILPIGATGVMLALDDLAGGSYLQNINGKDGSKLDVPPLAIGKMQRLHLAVKQQGPKTRIVGKLNGKEFLKWEGPTNSLMVRPSWAIPYKEALGLGVHESTVVFFRLDLRMLSGKAEKLKFPPSPPPALRRHKGIFVIQARSGPCIEENL